MGGSGGGPSGYPRSGPGGGGNAGGSNGGADACALNLNTNLFGPVAGVANQLSVGDVLDIRLVGSTPAQVGVFASTLGGAQVGSIGGLRQLPTLIECLEGGVAYAGHVTAINGSNIQIRIQNV